MRTRTQLRCDFCDANAPLVFVFEHGPFAVLTAGTVLHSQEAGYMGACDECRPLVEAKDLTRLLERARQAGVYNEAVRHLHAQVLRHLTGYRFVSRVGDPDGSPRFFTYACVKCGHQTRIDAESYEQTTSFRCERCGVATTLVSHAPGPVPRQS